MASRTLPSVIRKYIVHQLTPKFRDAVQLQSVPCPRLEPGQLLVKNRYVGINASDINFTSARYDPTTKPPFDCGFEGVGEVVAVGSGSAEKFSAGQAIGYIQYGAFADYVILSERVAIPLPAVRPEYLPLLVSGLTAAMSLDKVGEIRPNETVLVTAAAGGTGQFAVQWAKRAGCHVIGTCSDDSKVELLKKLGCDRPINYNKENLASVLKSEYPNGVDVVYESIGGKTFETALKALAIKGRLIIIGFISSYESEFGLPSTQISSPEIIARLLAKSTSIRGFFLNNYLPLAREYLPRLVELVNDNQLYSTIDNGKTAPRGPFRSLESIPDAIEYMYSRKNVGKVIVELPDSQSKL